MSIERAGSITSQNEFFVQFLWNESGYIDDDGNVFILKKESSIKRKIGFVDQSGSVYSCGEDDSLEFVGHVDKTGNIWLKQLQSKKMVGFVLFSDIYVRGDVYIGERDNDSRYQYREANDKNREIERKIMKWGAAALLLTSPSFR